MSDENKPVDAFEGLPAPGKRQKRIIKLVPVEPLTQERKDQIVEAAFLWARAREMEDQGEMASGEYYAYKKRLMDLLETKEV